MPSTNVFYKLMILYILDRVSYPMTSYQLSDYLIDKEYTDYFTFKEELSSLLELGFVSAKKEADKTFYEITAQGRESLGIFKDEKISPAIRDEIDGFLGEKGYEFRSDNLTSCYYEKNSNGEYDVRATVKEGDNVLLDLCVALPDETQAKKAKENWRKNKDEIYGFIMQKLL